MKQYDKALTLLAVCFQVDHWREFIDHCVELGVYKGCDLPLNAVNI